MTSLAATKLAVIAVDGSGTPRLIDVDPRIGSVAFLAVQPLPGSNALACPITQDGISNLWVQPLDGSPGHQLTHFPSESITDFRWSPNGKTLAVIREHNISDVVMLKDSGK